MSSGVEIFVFQDGRFLGSRCFSKSSVTIGSDADLRLNDPSLQPHHAVLRIDANALALIDNGGQAGVFVNDERISICKVSDTDEVKIGSFRLKITRLAEATADTGFGADAAPEPDEEDAETFVQRFDQVGRESADPLRGGKTSEATTPRIQGGIAPEPALAPDFDDLSDEKTRAAEPKARKPRRPSKRAKQRPEDLPTANWQKVEAPKAPVPEEEPTRMARPKTGRKQLDDLAPADDMAGTEPDLDSLDAFAGGDVREATETGMSHDLVEPAGEYDADYWGEEEEEFVEPFSLLENIVRERFKTPTETESFTISEVICYSGGELRDLMRADPGQSIFLERDNFRLVQAHKDGRARLFFRDGFSGTVVRGGKSRTLDRLTRPDTLVNKRKKIHAIDLQAGDYAQIVRDDAGYLVRFVKPPKPPANKVGFQFNLASLQMLAGSAVFHFLVLAILGFATPEEDLVVDEDVTEEYADVKLPKLEKKEEPKPPEPPPPEPEKKEPEPEPEPEPKPEPKPKKQPKPKKLPKPKVSKKAPAKSKPQPRANAAQKKAAAGVLSALQNLKASGAPGRSNLKSITSNIKAVRSSGSSRFKVTGPIGKSGSSRVRYGGKGSGRDAAAGKGLLASNAKVSNLKGKVSTRTRGRVRRAPTRSISAKGGELSRAEIQKVVMRHMRKIQACYERQLISQKSLAGKMVFDWKISPSGTVSSTRLASSSMSSTAVASCIVREIKRWRFPKPRGGSVQVRYPFVFKVSGF